MTKPNSLYIPQYDLVNDNLSTLRGADIAQMVYSHTYNASNPVSFELPEN